MNSVSKEKLKEYLVPVEQELLSYLTPDTVVLFAIIKEINKSHGITSGGNLWHTVSSLERKGKLVRIKKGKYYVCGAGAPDYFLIGQHLFGGYLGFSTALWIHGLKTEEPYVCYLAAPSGSGGKRIGKMQYRRVALGNLAIGSTYIKRYRVSTKAKTLFDCLHIPKYAGGFHQILYALKSAGLTSLEWEEFFRYLALGRTAAIQRAGYLLQTAEAQGALLPTGWSKEVCSMIKKWSVCRLDSRASKKGRYIKDWRIYDNVFQE